MHSYFFLTLLFICQFSFAENKPSWVDHFPAETSEYRFYIGRSMDAISEEMGFTLATINAREQAISQNFGVFTKIKTETFQNSDNAFSTQNYQAISQQVQLLDFEQIDFYKTYIGDKLNIWVLFKYKKGSIKVEKDRIAKLKNDQFEKFSLLQSGNEENAKNSGTLEVTSEPSGAPVRIDGLSKIGDLELRTPLKLMGLFSAGKHTIEIDHPNYIPTLEDINLLPGLTTKISKILTRANAEIIFESKISGATIFLGTKMIGTTPLKENIKVLAGTVANIEIRHPEMQTFTTQMQLKRNESKILNAELIPLESFVALSSDPSGATIELNGQLIKAKTPSGPIKVLKGTHHLKISSPGFKSKEIKFEIKGGESLVIPLSVLETQKQATINGLNLYYNSEIKIDSKKIEIQNDQINLEPKSYKIEINKIGFYPFEKTIELDEGDIFDLASIQLTKIPDVFDRLTHPKFSIGFVFQALQATSNSPNNSINAIGGNLRFLPFRWIGFDFSYLGQDSTIEGTYAKPIKKFKGEIIKFGVPIKIFRPQINSNDGFYLIPELIKVKTTYSDLSKNSITNQQQQGKGASLEYRIYTTPDKNSNIVYGLSIQLGMHKYEFDNHFKSKEALSTGLGFHIGF